jgi:Tfp pilus assembly protein PilN
MRNLEASDWFESPRLEVIQAVEKVDEKTKEVLRGSQFTLHVKQTGVEVEDGGKDAKNKTNPKAKAGAKT